MKEGTSTVIAIFPQAILRLETVTLPLKYSINSHWA
jgi:hypothetical protein